MLQVLLNTPDVLGLQSIVGLTPSPEEAELVHNDKQLLVNTLDVVNLQAIVGLTPPTEEVELAHIDGLEGGEAHFNRKISLSGIW